MADFLIMARDTDERSGEEWITQLGALNLWGVNKLSPHGKDMQKGDRAVFYWTSKKLFVGSCVIGAQPEQIEGPTSPPLLEGSKFKLTLSGMDLWESPVSNRTVNAKGIGIKWSPGSLLRLSPGQYEAVVALASEGEVQPTPDDTTREAVPKDHTQIQAHLACLAMGFGFQVWIPKSDQSRVLAVKSDIKEHLLEHPPLGAADAKYTAEIDCIWFQDNQVMAAFEVEATTSIYSGLLRMADLVAVYPSISFDLFIVAPADRQDKFVGQVRRPVFTKMKTPLAAKCGFLSFEQIKSIYDLQTKAKGHLQMSIMRVEAHWER